MLVVEAKLKNGTPEQYQKLDEAIKTSQFVRNKCVRYWMDNKGTTRNDLQKLCALLANNKDTPWVNKLNSQARQSAADRAWQSINRFYHNCRAKIPEKKGFPRFKKYSRSVEYKLTGYKLSDDRRKIKFTDGFKAGEFDLWCRQKTLVYYSEEQIRRVRVVRRADGYYCQFLIDVYRGEHHEPTGQRVKVAKLHLKVSRQCPNCKTVLDRDHNAAINILKKGLQYLGEYLNGSVGHTPTDPNALGESDLWVFSGDIENLSCLVEQGISNSDVERILTPLG